MIKNVVPLIDIDHFARDSTAQWMPAIGVSMPKHADIRCGGSDAVRNVSLNNGSRNGHISR